MIARYLMSYCDLLERMMHRDTDAFLEMTDRYGWALYSEIRNKYPDKSEADRIYDETMQQFYRSLQNPACEDPMEALLCAFADRISEQKGIRADPFMKNISGDDISPPSIQLKNTQIYTEQKTGKRKGRFWFRLAALLLAIGFFSVIWIGVGLMMEAGMIPYFDLGYHWFADLVSQWI